MDLPRTLGEALACARGRIDTVDARVLLREASGAAASTLVAFPERILPGEAARRFMDWLTRRAAGEPVAHILGQREFYGHLLQVTADTLIPRPDTELLVERALAVLGSRRGLRVLDLGTGSGAIAIAIALAREVQVTAVDASAPALAVAQGNAQRLGAAVRCVLGDWFAPVAGEVFDVIVSNPPYIRESDPHLALGDVRFEPRSALTAGADGLDDIRVIIVAAPVHLAAGGWLLLEHGYDQAAAVRALLAAAGFTQIESWRDLAGIERVTGACRSA